MAIIMTTDPTPELALHCMRLGAYGYLRKPFEPTSLVDLCARALRERALLRVEELLEERTRALGASEKRSIVSSSRVSLTPSSSMMRTGLSWP